MLPDLKNPKQLSAAIKANRQARKWTQEELASKVDVSPSQIASYESFGKRNFTVPRPAIYNALNAAFFDIAQKTVGATVPPLAVKDASDEELIRELKDRGVSWFKYARAK